MFLSISKSNLTFITIMSIMYHIYDWHLIILCQNIYVFQRQSQIQYFKILIVEEKSHKMHIIVSICSNIIMVGTIDNLSQVGTICDFQKL
jgi:hypothetical protein